MKLSYQELDSRKLKAALSRDEETVVEVTSPHADAVNALVDLVTDIKCWPDTKPSVVEKWIVLQKAFLLAIRSLLFHAQLVELLPALMSSKIETQRFHQSDGSVVLHLKLK